MRLRHLELTPNFALRSAIVDWAQANDVRLTERATQAAAQPVFKWDDDRAGNILHVGAARYVLLLGAVATCWVAGKARVQAWQLHSVGSKQRARQPPAPQLASLQHSLCFDPHPQFPSSLTFHPSPVFLSFLPPSFSAVQGHTEIIWAIEVQGDRVYTASADKTVRVWDLATKRCLQVGGWMGKWVLLLSLRRVVRLADWELVGA
jgi:F-box/WD-40 domain protein 7